MTQSLAEAMRAFAPVLPLAVALSGGADSTALLVQCTRRWPGQIHALHINHGLQAAAADFQQHCHSLCAALGVPLRVKNVQAGHASGQSPEDAARIARYEGLLELAQGDLGQPSLPAIALAQHADDQVETLLLALSRGAGMAGLSAMPRQWQRGGVLFYRPLLEVAGSAIRDWLGQEQIAHVTDPSNVDERYTRNRIRAQVIPALQATFPHFRDTFARSASHAAQAQVLLDEIAAQDLALVLRARDGLPLLQALKLLSEARQGNALRHWLKSSFDVIPSAAQLRELQSQIAASATRGHRIHIKVGLGFCERRGAVLAWYNPMVLPHRK
jgi:tRNA(Ile)-lysidine synthase